MGQKVNPHGLRVGVIKDWSSRWFVSDKDFGDTLVSDYNIRNFLKKTLYAAGVAKVEIERDAARVRINIHCAKPGIVIGKGGAEIEALKEALKGTDYELIKTGVDSLQKTFMDISQKLYQAQGGAQQDPNMGANPGNDQQNGGYYDADFEDKGN